MENTWNHRLIPTLNSKFKELIMNVEENLVESCWLLEARTVCFCGSLKLTGSSSHTQQHLNK